jgi:Putative bacterial sensory transduction regulator
MATVDVVDAYVGSLPGASRRPAHAEWGITLDAEQAAGWPLDVGLRIADGLLTVKAHALTDPEHVDPWMLLWWNRSTRMVRFNCTQAREVWVHADLPVAAVDERELDRLLGLVVEAAVAVRDFQRSKREPPEDGGWLSGAQSVP